MSKKTDDKTPKVKAPKAERTTEVVKTYRAAKQKGPAVTPKKDMTGLVKTKHGTQRLVRRLLLLGVPVDQIRARLGTVNEATIERAKQRNAIVLTRGFLDNEEVGVHAQFERKAHARHFGIKLPEEIAEEQRVESAKKKAINEGQRRAIEAAKLSAEKEGLTNE